MRLRSDPSRRNKIPWAVLAFIAVGAFLLFYRPPKPQLPLGLSHPYSELGSVAPTFPDDAAQVAAILKTCEAEEPPPADLAMVRRIAALLTETEGEGWFKFFYTEAGNDADAIIADLRTIGAEKSAAILEEACKRFPKGKPHRELVLRRRQIERMDEFGPELLDLDRRFLLRDESLAELLKAHLAQ